MVRAFARIKKACARVNGELQRLSPEKVRAIAQACDEVLAGRYAEQFVVDVYQAGAGTSFHMNVNEVLAGRAAEILGKPRGDRSAVNPNDEVNLGQSTNDTFPTALHLAALAVGRTLVAEVGRLERSFARKGEEFAGIVKSGRTHLMDAVPVTLGQEFRAFATAMERRKDALARALDGLRELALGGTAAGTGLNTPRRVSGAGDRPALGGHGREAHAREGPPRGPAEPRRCGRLFLRPPGLRAGALPDRQRPAPARLRAGHGARRDPAARRAARLLDHAR